MVVVVVVEFAWSQRKEPLISALHFQRLVMLKEDKDSDAGKTFATISSRSSASLQEVQCHCCDDTKLGVPRLYSLTYQKWCGLSDARPDLVLSSSTKQETGHHKKQTEATGNEWKLWIYPLQLSSFCFHILLLLFFLKTKTLTTSIWIIRKYFLISFFIFLSN